MMIGRGRRNCSPKRQENGENDRLVSSNQMDTSKEDRMMSSNRRTLVSVVVVFAVALSISASAADNYTFKPTQIKHGVVIGDTTGKWAYHWPREMPAQWGSEMVIHCAKNPWSGDKGGHEVGKGPGKIHGLQLRSTDDGETWTEEGGFKDRLKGSVKPPIDFKNPNFCARRGGRGTHYISYDRAKTWLGPWEAWVGLGGECKSQFHLKNDGKTAVIVTDRRHLSKWRHNCGTLLTTDQGRTWSLGGVWKGRFKGPKGVQDMPVSIGPYSVRLGEDELLAVGRSRFGGQLHRSTDFGKSWKPEGVVHAENASVWVECWLVVLGGEYPDNPNPKHIIAVWGARGGMKGTDSKGNNLGAGPRARYSRDGGRTWSENVVQLRNDGQGRSAKGPWDTGEPVAYERTDGKIIMIYYWQTDTRPQPYIAYTVFDPNVGGNE